MVDKNELQGWNSVFGEGGGNRRHLWGQGGGKVEYPGLEARGHDVRYTFHNVSANVTRELSPPFIIAYPN